MVPVAVGALWAVTSKLGEWLQRIPEITPETSVQKSAILERAKILHRTLSSQDSYRVPKLEGDTKPPTERWSGEFFKEEHKKKH